MEEEEKIKQRFELLKMARELLNEDYINRRAEDHNKWVAENEESWRTKRRNVPYPPFAQYPADDEIVRAAANLYNFIYHTAHNASGEEPKVQEQAPTQDQTHVPIITPFEQGASAFKKPEKVAEVAPAPVAEKPTEEVKEVEEVEEIPTTDPNTTINALINLKKSIDPSDRMSNMSIDHAITLENQQNADNLIGLRRYLPGWVRRTEKTEDDEQL